jgi:hypothetical protein
MHFKNILFGMTIAAATFATVATASATVVVGPGQNPVNSNDTAWYLDVVELDNAQTLAAGTYTATTLNTQFTGTPQGTITPFLAVASGNGYTPIAIGSAIDASSATPAFASTAFGGSDRFTLTSATTVYAGVYSTSTGNMAVGFDNGVGSTYITYGYADAPVLGQALSGNNIGQFSRTYDFSINVSAVPELSTWAMMLAGFGALAFAGYRRKVAAAA